MGLSKGQIADVERVLTSGLRHKFQNYNPEPASMPFHTRLLGKDRLALYSFIHSLSTNFGTTIFEPVAIAIAKNRFKVAKSHVIPGEYIYEDASWEIQRIIDGLTTAASSPNKNAEIDAIRKVCKKGTRRKVSLTRVDILLETKTNDLYLFDLKTAKPNVGGFREFKRTLLEWTAAVLALNPKAKVNTLIAIPYNPYEPKPYNRWTMRGMLDLENELKVGRELWDFLGGIGAYENLLDCFERVGIELRDEIDEYFARFNR
jgi:type II restriction enzyme